MEKINITCNDKIKVQSSLDFYLGITSVGDISSLKELRKSMFRKFMKEYQDINYPLVDLSKQQSEELETEVETYEDTKNSANNFLQFLQKMKENTTEEDTEEDDEFIEYSQEEDEFIDSAQEEEQEEFIDYSQEEEDGEDISEENIEIEEDDIPGRTYVDHGLYIEDIIDGTVQIEDLYYGNEDDLSEEEQDIEENYDESEEELEEYEEDYADDEEELEEYEEEFNQDEEEQDSFDFGEDVEYEDIEKEEEVIVETPKNEVSIEDDGLGADVPSDIRTFLKQHPNSDMLYVSKFYPKKEIEKQLKLGRIYKRKGKLFI